MHSKRGTSLLALTLFFHEGLNIKPTFLLQLIACQHTSERVRVGGEGQTMSHIYMEYTGMLWKKMG